jgi:hypothetical protein
MDNLEGLKKSVKEEQSIEELIKQATEEINKLYGIKVKKPRKVKK